MITTARQAQKYPHKLLILHETKSQEKLFTTETQGHGVYPIESIVREPGLARHQA